MSVSCSLNGGNAAKKLSSSVSPVASGILEGPKVVTVAEKTLATKVETPEN